MPDLHCAGCGAITPIPPLCGVCFATIGAARPISVPRRAPFDYAVPLPGCIQHMTRAQLREFVVNSREFPA